MRDYWSGVLTSKYFARICALLDIKSKDELATVLRALGEKKLQIPRWEFHGVNSSALMGFDELATTP